jgi:hypothetical protein
VPFGDLTVSAVQPYQARKPYLCPGCASTIEAGVGHVVVIPELAPDLRRHWHRGCWFKELRRRGGRARPDEVTPHPSASRP